MNTKFYVIAILLALSMDSVMSQNLDSLCVNSLEPLFTGNCASDYAVVVASAVELGWCLKDKANLLEMKISAQDIICNCADCHTIKGNGCMGGSYTKALLYLKDGKGKGGSYPEVVTYKPAKSFDTVTNGPKNYHDCLNYFMKPCDPDQETCVPVAFNPATHCGKVNCDRKPEILVANAGITGLLEAYNIKKGMAEIQATIQANKPIISTMEIFEDMEFFLGSETGVYVHTSGQSLGVVNVIIVGYG